MNYGISAYYVSDLITDMFENEFVCKKWNGIIGNGMNIIFIYKKYLIIWARKGDINEFTGIRRQTC